MRYVFAFFLLWLSLMFRGKIGARRLLAVPVILISLLVACDDTSDVPANFVAGFVQSTLSAPEITNTHQIEIRMKPESSYDGTIKVFVQTPCSPYSNCPQLSGATYGDDFTIDTALSTDPLSSWFTLPIRTGDTKISFTVHFIDDALPEAEESVEFIIDSLNGLTVLQTNTSTDRLLLIIQDDD